MPAPGGVQMPLLSVQTQPGVQMPAVNVKTHSQHEIAIGKGVIPQLNMKLQTKCPTS